MANVDLIKPADVLRDRIDLSSSPHQLITIGAMLPLSWSKRLHELLAAVEKLEASGHWQLVTVLTLDANKLIAVMRRRE